MKTLLGNIAVTGTQKEMIMSHPYLRAPEYGFKFSFERPQAEIDPFVDMEPVDEPYYEMTAELDAMGWISVGRIIERTKVTV